jgi:hypothetical protein
MSVIACGWYTPDYAIFVAPLLASLEAYGNRHDFVPVAKCNGGWERNTLQMADQIRAAMERHPDDVIVFLNVDATVRGSLALLAEEVTADVAFSLRAKRKPWGRCVMHPNTGTVVFRPTLGAREFVERWSELSSKAVWGDTDQLSLTLAIAQSPHTSLQPLSEKWWGSEGDPAAVILHDRASRGQQRISKLERIVRGLLRPSTGENFGACHSIAGGGGTSAANSSTGALGTSTSAASRASARSASTTTCA